MLVLSSQRPSPLQIVETGRDSTGRSEMGQDKGDYDLNEVRSTEAREFHTRRGDGMGQGPNEVKTRGRDAKGRRGNGTGRGRFTFGRRGTGFRLDLQENDGAGRGRFTFGRHGAGFRLVLQENDGAGKWGRTGTGILFRPESRLVLIMNRQSFLCIYILEVKLNIHFQPYNSRSS